MRSVITDNLPDHPFTAGAPNQTWVADFNAHAQPSTLGYLGPMDFEGRA
jgi:hypothetical protein